MIFHFRVRCARSGRRGRGRCWHFAPEQRQKKLEQGLPSRETSEIVTFSVSRQHGSLGICCRNRFSHRADRDKHLSGKRMGGGVSFMINDSWCNHNNIQELKSFCSPNLEFLTIKCRPFYQPREFSTVIVTTVYIPPQADTNTALKELLWTLCKLETKCPEATFIVAEDFNKAYLRTGLTKFYQHTY